MQDKSFQMLRINTSARSASCVGDHAVFIGGHKKFVKGHEYSMHHLYTYESRIFSRVSKIQEGHARC